MAITVHWDNDFSKKMLGPETFFVFFAVVVLLLEET